MSPKPTVLAALASAALASAAMIASPARATVLDFDSLTSGDDMLTNYGGYNWFNFRVQSSVLLPVGGFVPGAVSPDNVAFNAGVHEQLGNEADIYIEPADTPSFDFIDAFLTAAFRSDITLTVKAGRGSGFARLELFSTSFNIVPDAAQHVFFGWTDIDWVSFRSSAQDPDANINGPADQFVLDNITLNSHAPPDTGPRGGVPEPGAWALMLSGFFGVGGLLRNRRRLAAAT